MPVPSLDFSASFGDGLAVIRQEHAVMLDCCIELRALGTQVDLDEQKADFAERARRMHDYFAIATERHHRDEEQALFPVLLPDSPDLVRGMIECLEEDHRELEDVWVFLAPLLHSPGNITDRGLFVKACNRFAQLLEWHIQREEDNFLPQIENILTQQQRQAIGATMQAMHRAASGTH